MTKAFLYSFTKEVTIPDQGMQKQNFCTIFFPYKKPLADLTDIQIQLRDYFQRNVLPDRLIIICLEFNQTDVKSLFEKSSSIFDYIPKFGYDENQNSIHVLSLQHNGEIKTILGKNISDTEIQEIYNRGMMKIFNDNGGLIIAQSAHHFVFPSGKHCDRFLRTGNVLIHGAQILFIASSLLRHFKNREIEYIYCDTSSINSIAYSFISLLRELNPSFVHSIHVESFGSYEMFEKSKFESKKGSIFFISSSTSGSILERMTEASKENKKKNIAVEDIAVIYGLNVKNAYISRVICDLTLNKKTNPDGIAEFKSDNVSKGELCKFCHDGSKPIKVEGDVFLLEKPLVNGHLIKTTNAPKCLKDLGDFYKKTKKEDEPIIKCYHKEMSAEKKYEIYIDVAVILENWKFRNDDENPYSHLNKKLEKYILQNVPASLKYMIVLPDDASDQLARIISEVLREQGLPFADENIIGIKSGDLQKIKPNNQGVIAVISSSVVTGSNLLYLSRALRDLGYQRMFFTYISRTANVEHYEFLKSNIGLGEFGIDSHKIFNVETIFCSEEAQTTPWHIEEDFIKTLQEYFEDKEYAAISLFCDNRIKELSNCGRFKGLGNNLFFPALRGDTLAIRKGFAFSPYLKGKSHDNFIDHSKQSEIYFIISTVLNDLRNKYVLFQSQYVRNLIAPGNFVRYNDGIIQSSFLRAASNDELNYSLSEEMSLQMKSILGDMILHIEDDHAEALNEFFYAIAIKKLKLTKAVINDCIELLEQQDYYKENDLILKGLVKFIKDRVISKPDISTEFKELPMASGNLSEYES